LQVRKVNDLNESPATVNNPAKACKANASMIAHSIGNYVVQKAMVRRGLGRTFAS
jgi:hypothetical protein